MLFLSRKPNVESSAALDSPLVAETTQTALTMAHQSFHCDTESVSFLFLSEDDDDLKGFTWWLMDSHLLPKEDPLVNGEKGPKINHGNVRIF